MGTIKIVVIVVVVVVKPVQLNPVILDTEGAIENVRISTWGVHNKQVEFRENVRAFLPHGQSKLSVIMRCPY